MAIEWLNTTPADWPSEMPNEFEFNKIYRIPHLKLARLATDTDEKQLLFRQQTLDLFKYLTDSKRGLIPDVNGVVIEGAPGIGKSCTTWLWLLWLLWLKHCKQMKAKTASVAESQTKVLIQNLSNFIY